MFPTLPRECYEAPYEDRNAVVARLGLAHSYSKQAWNLRDGIFDVQRHLDGRMLETHPELAFWARAGGDLAPKRTRAGVAARAELLLGEGVEVGDVSWPAALPVDDVLDAAICAVVARARTRGEARFVPAGVDPELDAVIWY